MAERTQSRWAVDRGVQRWDLERQVRLVAGSIVLSSVLGSVAIPRLKWVAAAIGGGLTYCGPNQHLRYGNGTVQVALQPRCDNRCQDNLGSTQCVIERKKVSAAVA